MAISVADFIAQNNGKSLKSPHGILGQCVSVPSLYAVDNGWAELFGAGDDTALHIYNNGVTGYTRVVNTPTGVPAVGDFVFFSAAYGGGAGHVGVVSRPATVNSVTLFEQNDPYGSSAHEKTYNYSAVLGWFHHPSLAPVAAPTGAGTYPIKSTVNVRTAPSVTAPVVAQLHPGTVEVLGIVTGTSGTVGTKTSTQWGITQNEHYFSMAATQ